MNKKIYILLLFLALFPFNANASEVKLLDRFGDWSAYMLNENGNRVCYMAGNPTRQEGDYTQRGDIYALITHRPGEGTRDVFSYITGYTYRPGSEVTLNIDSKKFVLLTQNDTAWASDADADSVLAQAIQDGSTMIVRGVSSRGTQTKDTFSLRGTTAAYKKITEACGL